jgi:hypothetical protein
VARVFVSHASQDRVLAAELHEWLADDGHDVFLDRDLHDGISLGEEREQRLYERLRWADAMVFWLPRPTVTQLGVPPRWGLHGRRVVDCFR